jgi:predicted ribosome-associated RNA-binding protein Tma20
MTEVGGRVLGFDTDDIIRVWRFDWSTEQDLYSVNGDPVAFLKEDFYLVPYISGLDEMMTQTYPVFSTQDPGKNIVFHVKN